MNNCTQSCSRYVAVRDCPHAFEVWIGEAGDCGR